MNCVVTAGPTYEPLDDVRRLTNFSTGRLGTELAAFLSHRGHHVTLLIGEMAVWRGDRTASEVQEFSTTANLRDRLKASAQTKTDAIFHAAAVSDFSFGKIHARPPGGELTELHAGKISTGQGTLLAELKPTPKIIAELRHWFPKTKIIGWKFEVDGTRQTILSKAKEQILTCRTNACVPNGPAYGSGFGLVRPAATIEHFETREELFAALEKLAAKSGC